MAASEILDLGLPMGHRAVPLRAEDESAPLRVCVVVRDPADAVGGPFVLLRTTADAAIFLGCVTDAAGLVHAWLEIWTQTPLPEALALHDTLSNHLLDERWKRRAAAMRASDPASFFTTGWETAPSGPVFFDSMLKRPQPGGAYELCIDDAALEKAGLPRYTTSLHRYLLPTGSGEEPRFFPISAGAPESERTTPLSAIAESSILFNPVAGAMMLRRFAPLGAEEWLDLLSGRAWKGVGIGQKLCRLSGTYRTLADLDVIAHGAGHLLLGRKGRAGRLLEAFHLKVSFLAETIRLVREHVRAMQLPLLNVSAESFRVALADVDHGLPQFYTARTSLVRPADSFPVDVESEGSRYFLPANSEQTSIYRAAAEALPVHGTGIARLRKLLPATGDGTSIEGTLVTQERLPARRNDFLQIRLALGTQNVVLHGHLELEGGLAAGEVRFRTLPQKLSDAARAALQGAEGVSLSNTAFAIIPVLSTPCDLYGLAVLGVRALLVNDGNTLPVALDELLSLAAKVASAHDPDVALHERVASIVNADPHWREALGPHRLLHGSPAKDDPLIAFPAELWARTLAALIRCFPGVGPDSHCRDFGDALPLALEAVFNEPLSAFEQLASRSRSLMVGDWLDNREVRSVIDAVLQDAG